MDDIKIDPRDKKIRPCSHCEAVVQECLEDFESDRVYMYVEDGDPFYDFNFNIDEEYD